MKRTWGFLAAAGAVAMLAGCFTVHHSPYPDVRMSSLPEGRRMAVQLTGFAATLTTYVPVYGYETVYGYNRGWWHHGRYYAGYYGPSTYSTTTYLPQTAPTTAFIERAQEALEGAGFGVNATGATYRVEVKFSGPVVTDGDRTAQALWLILSALSGNAVGTKDYTEAIIFVIVTAAVSGVGLLIYNTILKRRKGKHTQDPPDKDPDS